MSEDQNTILVVDDKPQNIEVLNALLRGLYRIKAAPNGQRALELARRTHPDLILLDIMMPEMDGYEVCRRLKADPVTASIPVIFITAKNLEVDEARGFEAGAVDFIAKPISPQVTLARVRTHLELRRIQAELERKNEALEAAARLRDDVERITRHDLKAPLNGIIPVPAVLIGRYDFTPTHLKLLRSIEASGRKMLAMINRSLDLYKMETGRYKAMIQPINVMPVLRGAAEDSAASPAGKGKRWRITHQGDEADADREVWAQAEKMLCYPMFSNLIQNAFEASPPGGLVEIDADEQDATRVRIAITNHGVPPEAVRGRFFEKYVTAGKSQGTGLGTYSAKLCAEAQHGAIRMTVLDDARTRVTVQLPRKRPPTREELEALLAEGWED